MDRKQISALTKTAAQYSDCFTDLAGMLLTSKPMGDAFLKKMSF